MSPDLYQTLQKHPSHPEIVQGLSLEFPTAPTKPSRHSRPPISHIDTVSARSTVKHLTLSKYHFPAQPAGLQIYLDFSQLTTLDLQDCHDIGYLFNNILCNISNCRIKILKIQQDFSRRKSQGYLGLDKIETFLQLHKGMKKLTLSGIEGDINPRAIAAQGRTLTDLAIQGSKPPRKDGVCTSSPLPLLTMHETLEMCTALPELQTLQIDATSDEMILVSKLLSV